MSQNKMLDRSPRRSVSTFRDRVCGGSVNMAVRRLEGSLQQAPNPMPIEIALHQWQTNTRPCDFSLYMETPHGAVFADFDVDFDQLVSLRRISFDGYGCCRTEGKCSKMPSDESVFLIKAIRENDVNNQFVFDLLCRYFSQNDSIIWSDALLEHGLVETPNANAEDGIL
jgi:hypothetical protein